uniref:GTP-binding protein n=1 Tax=Bifidobacterium adolescentis TaxID=1680 RepID=UPI003FF00203
MKQIVAGIVAHVDAGKTTLSEALLYRTGEIRKLGRVDHGDAFLDTNSLEKARGITIFAHQALVEHGDLRLPAMEQSTEGSAVPLDAFAEDIATLDEEAMNDYLEHGALSVGRLRAMIAVRELFPVYFGSALKLEGVEEFLDGLETFTREREWPAAFAARVFK